MNEADTYQILSDTFQAVIFASGPIMGIALVIGLVIAFFQALTQVQEMTLTFVPKIVAIFAGLLVFIPFMYAVVKGLADTTFDLIVNGSF